MCRVVLCEWPAGTREGPWEGNTVAFAIKLFLVAGVIIKAAHPPLAQEGVPEDLWAPGKTGLPGNCHLLVEGPGGPLASETHKAVGPGFSWLLVSCWRWEKKSQVK